MGGNRPTYDVDGYSRGNANIDETERFSTTESPSPWYLKRWVLALWGLAVVILIAIIIYGLAILARGGGGSAPTPATTHSSTTTSSHTTSPSSTTPTTTDILDRDHRTRAAAGHRDVDAATSLAPLVAK